MAEEAPPLIHDIPPAKDSATAERVARQTDLISQVHDKGISFIRTDWGTGVREVCEDLRKNPHTSNSMFTYARLYKAARDAFGGEGVFKGIFAEYDPGLLTQRGINETVILTRAMENVTYEREEVVVPVKEGFSQILQELSVSK